MRSSEESNLSKWSSGWNHKSLPGRVFSSTKELKQALKKHAIGFDPSTFEQEVKERNKQNIHNNVLLDEYIKENEGRPDNEILTQIDRDLEEYDEDINYGKLEEDFNSLESTLKGIGSFLSRNKKLMDRGQRLHIKKQINDLKSYLELMDSM